MQRIAHLNGRRLVERVANSTIHIIDLPRSVLGRLGLLVQARSKASSKSDTSSSGSTGNGGNDDGVNGATIINGDNGVQVGLQRAVANDGVGARNRRADTQVAVVVDSDGQVVLANLGADKVEGAEHDLEVEDHALDDDVGVGAGDDGTRSNVSNNNAASAVLSLSFQADEGGSEEHSTRLNVRVGKSQVVVQRQANTDVSSEDQVGSRSVVVQLQSRGLVDGDDVDGDNPVVDTNSVVVATVLELVGDNLERVSGNVGGRSVAELPSGARGLSGQSRGGRAVDGSPSVVVEELDLATESEARADDRSNGIALRVGTSDSEVGGSVHQGDDVRNGQNTRLVGGDRAGVSGDDGGTRQVVDRGDSDGDGLSVNRVLVAVVDLVGDLGVVAVGVVVLVEARSEAKSREQSADRVPISGNFIELKSASREGANGRSDGNLVTGQISQRGSSGQLQSSDDGLQLIELDVTTAQPNVNRLSEVGVSGTIVFQESAVREARNSSEVVVDQIGVLDNDRGVINSAEEDLNSLGPRGQLGALVLVARVVLAASGFLDVVGEERLREQHRGLVLGVGVEPANEDSAVVDNAVTGLDFDGTSSVTSQNGRAVLVQLAAEDSFASNQNVVGKLRDVGISGVTFTVEEVEGQFNRDVFVTNRGSHLSPRSVVDTNNIYTNDDVIRPGASVADTVGELIELVVTIVRGISRSVVDDTSLRVANENGDGGDEFTRLGTSSIELVETTDSRGSDDFGQNGVNSVGGNTSQAEDGTVELVVIVEVVFGELDVADG